MHILKKINIKTKIMKIKLILFLFPLLVQAQMVDKKFTGVVVYQHKVGEGTADITTESEGISSH